MIRMGYQSVKYGAILVTVLLACSTCNRHLSNSLIAPTTNSEASSAKPYLFLISLDGFRWDYVEQYKPPHLSAFIEQGVQAESLIPSFPTKTFPNHYTIATGLYPDNHGLLGNNFFSYEKQVIYNIRNRELVEDGAFYGGSPIWIQASKAGMLSASYFFVGTEANIQGLHPTYYHRFDGSVENELRVEQALNWLALPEATRPHLITMYFSDMDDTGHSFGPNNEERIKESLFDLDTVLGDLFQGIKKTGLPVNVIIVSDHGMLEVPLEKYIPIEMVKDDELYLTVNNGAIVNIHPKDISQLNAIYNSLKTKEKNFKVYKTKNTPYFEYAPKNRNWGAIQVIPDEGYYFSGARVIGLKRKSPKKVFGQHGFSPDLKEMHGIFYANGPAFKPGYKVPSVKNIHVYPLMCKILGLEVPKNIDGDLKQLESVLQLEN